MGWVSSTINTVGSLITTGLANANNRKMAEDAWARERAASIADYNRQRVDALSDWARENDYNNPAAQNARLRAAGINPDLSGGVDSGNASSVSQSSINPASYDTPIAVTPTWAVDVGDDVALEVAQMLDGFKDLDLKNLERNLKENEVLSKMADDVLYQDNAFMDDGYSQGVLYDLPFYKHFMMSKRNRRKYGERLSRAFSLRYGNVAEKAKRYGSSKEYFENLVGSNTAASNPLVPTDTDSVYSKLVDLQVSYSKDLFYSGYFDLLAGTARSRYNYDYYNGMNGSEIAGYDMSNARFSNETNGNNAALTSFAKVRESMITRLKKSLHYYMLHRDIVGITFTKKCLKAWSDHTTDPNLTAIGTAAGSAFGPAGTGVGAALGGIGDLIAR